MLTQPRVVRMLHSILTSRVVLHIRAQAADNPAELNTFRFQDSDTYS